MMQKGILIIMIIGIFMGCVVGLPTNSQPITQNSVTLSKENPIESCSAVSSNVKSNKAINVVTSITGYPKTAHKGQIVKFKFVITNNGTKPIHNVRIDAQSVYAKLGTIKPGQSKTVIKSLKIYDSVNGGQGVYYTDYKGKIHHIEFKTIHIKLV